MDLTQAASLIGTGLATFAATWAGLVRPMKNRQADPKQVNAIGRKLDELRDELRAGLDEVKRAVTRLETRAEGQEKARESFDRRAERIEERIARSVTDEEFAAYTQQTTTALNGLTDRVGRAIGALDALR